MSEHSAMTPPEATERLNCEANASPAEVEAAYNAQYSELQLRLDQAPTAQMKQIYQRRLQELEQAKTVLLTGGTVNVGDPTADLPGKTPTYGPGPQKTDEKTQNGGIYQRSRTGEPDAMPTVDAKPRINSRALYSFWYSFLMAPLALFWPVLVLFFIPLLIVTIYYGHSALKQISISRGQERGKVLAMTGITLGYLIIVWLLIFTIVIIFFGLSYWVSFLAFFVILAIYYGYSPRRMHRRGKRPAQRD